MLHADEVVGRADIAEHVWDAPFEAMSNVIDVCVQRLRRKIDDPGQRLADRDAPRRGLHAVGADGATRALHDLVDSRAAHAWYSLVVVAVLVAGAMAVAVVQERLALERLDGELQRLMLTLEGVMRTEFGEGLDLQAPPTKPASRSSRPIARSC